MGRGQKIEGAGIEEEDRNTNLLFVISSDAWYLGVLGGTRLANNDMVGSNRLMNK